PCSPLLPYTTLFRSSALVPAELHADALARGRGECFDVGPHVAGVHARVAHDLDASRLRALLERRVHLFPVGAHRVGGEGTGWVVGHVHRVAAPARMNRPAAVLPPQTHHELPTSSKNAGAALRSVPHRMLRSQLLELLPALRTR